MRRLPPRFPAVLGWDVVGTLMDVAPPWQQARGRREVHRQFCVPQGLAGFSRAQDARRVQSKLIDSPREDR
ncbi:hypothetical protein BJF77_15700 [Kocuria sp. CNJ-770]|nr:hypothetical protein BJF77_15700 [Kocuria sp. CNJ-770]